MKRIFAIFFAGLMLCSCGSEGVESLVTAGLNAGVAPKTGAISPAPGPEEGADPALADRRPMIIWGGRTYLTSGSGAESLPEGFSLAGEVTSEVDQSELASKDGEANFSGSLGAEIYASPDDALTLWVKLSSGNYSEFRARPLYLLTLLDETYIAVDGYEFTAKSGSFTGLGATFSFKNNLSETAIIPYDCELHLIDGDSEYLISPLNDDIADGEYTVAPGEEIEIRLEWSHKYGELYDGTYRVVMSDLLGNKFSETVTVGSGEFDPANAEVITGKAPEDGEVEDPSESSVLEQNENQKQEKGGVGPVSAVQELDEQADYTVEISDAHSWGASVVYKNNTQRDVLYKDDTPLQRKIDGVWHDVLIDPDLTFPCLSMWLEAGDTLDFVKSWNGLYGRLENGEYRYVVEFYFERSDERVFAGAEFAVSDFGEPIPPGTLKTKSNVPRSFGIEMSVEQESVTPTSLRFTVTNNSTSSAEFGANFSICRKVGEEWYTLLEISDNVPMTLELYALPIGSSDSFEVSWENLYGSLPAGEYALVKNFSASSGMFENESGGGSTLAVAMAEFEVAE